MCTGDQTKQRQLPTMPPAVRDDGRNAAAAAAAEKRRRRREAKRAAAGALVPILLARLLLSFDQPVVFIGRKTVTRTDLDPHQNRFRLPTLGVDRHLLPMLTLDEAKAANLVENDEEGEEPPPPTSRPKKRQRTEKGSVVADGEQKHGMPPPGTNGEGEEALPPKPMPKKKKRRQEKDKVVADGEQKQGMPPPGTEEEQQQEGMPPGQQQKEEGTPGTEGEQPRARRQGKPHGGVPVTLVHLNAGMRRLLLVLWDSNNGTIIKGNGYMDFITWTGLQEHDTVTIWAFKRREFRLFGTTVPESPFYLVIHGGSRPPFEAPPPLCMAPPQSHVRVGVRT
ncbi:hypothetical protein E2562_017833 [Oryza meyeriana var. granulata]|uniref:Uncharacterized protein n=1 Tax=Oryza meyeriana var. granulata TaxID=110450 RepID=A0A6G1DYD1_9ORYZ|nr:hypothetical protein E2562_017833 [Oryza meyeriana var. granulata]